MANTFNNYDPSRVSLTFRGIIIQGYVSDTFIVVERTEDTFSMDVGAQGDVTRVRSRNKTGSVILTLQSGAPTNDLLSAVLLQDELSGTGYGPMMLKDLNGTTLCSAPIAWLRKPANVERAAEATPTEWAIDCATLNMFVGGFVL